MTAATSGGIGVSMSARASVASRSPSCATTRIGAPDGDRLEQLERLREGQRALFANAMVQGAAADPLGDLERQRRVTLEKAEVVDANGVRMRQPRQRERLLHEMIVARRVRRL